MRAAVERCLTALQKLVPDALTVLVLVSPWAASAFAWPVFGLFALISRRAVVELRWNPWVLKLVHDPATRVAHGLEHATLAVMVEEGLPASHGFTHGGDRFMVALEGRHHDRRKAVHQAAARAISRVMAGERALAYHPRCGTSAVVSWVTLWLAFCTSIVFSLAIGASPGIFLAILLLGVRFRCALDPGLGLLAQRLFTVSTAFASARVLWVDEVPWLHGKVCPDDETWFEVAVDIRPTAAEGGLVAPGVLA